MEKYIFSVEELDAYLKEHCVDTIRENPSKILEILDFEIHGHPIQEMAKCNSNDSMISPFPPNKFDIIMWPNNHNPPHFHVKGPEEWEVTFAIENGKPLKVKHIGKSSKFYKYMEKNIPVWLSQASAIDSGRTNKQILENLWKLYNKNSKLI